MYLFPKALVSIFILLWTSQLNAFSLERYVDGSHYKTLPNLAFKPNSVVEFFSFGCPHCYHLEPEVESWLEDKPDNVVFERVAAAWNKNFKVLAELYYTMESLGVAEQYADKVFDYLHQQKKTINNEAEAKALLVDLGLDAEKINAAWASEEVSNNVGQSNALFAKHRIRGVPAIVVNGKYLTNVSMAGSEKELLKVVDFLLGKKQ